MSNVPRILALDETNRIYDLAVASLGGAGSVGPEGPAGPAGPQGLTGDIGPAGLTGADGAQGPIGNTGPSGADGAQGIQGIGGAAGSDGATGSQGIQGVKGDTGAQGDPGQAWPIGSLFLSVVTTDPATLLGYGTWAAFGAGRMLLGFTAGDTDEATGGAATHSHAFTQPADHAALTHAGATVANHADVTNHVHVQSVNSAATGGLSGYTADTSTNTSVSSGYSTANPTSVGVAAMVHTVGQANQHAAMSHASGAVTDGATSPPYVIVHMWKRTA